MSAFASFFALNPRTFFSVFSHSILEFKLHPLKTQFISWDKWESLWRAFSSIIDVLDINYEHTMFDNHNVVECLPSFSMVLNLANFFCWNVFLMKCAYAFFFPLNATWLDLFCHLMHSDSFKVWLKCLNTFGVTALSIKSASTQCAAALVQFTRFVKVKLSLCKSELNIDYHAESHEELF